MTEHAASRSWSKTVVRLTSTILVVVATAIVLAIGISQWQDWQDRLQKRANLRELEARAIGIDNPAGPESFYPDRAVARPPIVTRFETLTVAEAEGSVAENELVLAVTIEGEARAYPLNMLNGPTREIINDELGGRSIAATW